MKILDTLKKKFEAIRQNIEGNPSEQNEEVIHSEPTEARTSSKQKKKSKNMFYYICQWIFKFRSLFMAIPVVCAAIILAVRNSAQLPEKISVYFPSTSADKVVIKLTELDRGTAVTIPFLITLACVALMCCSRRTVYPWLISIFSLILPVFFLFMGMYPV